MRLWEYTIHQIQKMLKAKTVSIREVVEDVFNRLEQTEPSTKAYIRVCGKEEILKKASAIEYRMRDESMRDLAGIPMALQDDICTDGVMTTCGSKMLKNFTPPYNAEVVDKLYEEDCILLGKTNLDAFGIGASTENSAFYPTINPLDENRIPGGAGGAAAAVAIGEAFFALGSDTGGAARQSASCCGIVGLKPTYGLVSRYGLITHAPSLVQIGSLTKDVQDCAIVLNAIAGYDKKDGNSVAVEKVDYRESLCGDIKGIRIGVLFDDFGIKVDKKIQDSIDKAAEVFESLGAQIERIRIPHLEYGFPVYLMIAAAESSSALARFDGIRYGYRSENVANIEDLFVGTRSEGFGKAEKMWMLLGSHVLQAGKDAERYQKVLRLRAQLQKDFIQAFEKLDLILSPTCPALTLEGKEQTEDLFKMHQDYACTAAANLAGLPALSIPCDIEQGIPIGMQLIGGFFKESMILKAAYAFEQTQERFQRRSTRHMEKSNAQMEICIANPAEGSKHNEI